MSNYSHIRSGDNINEISQNEGTKNGNYSHISIRDSVHHIANHPAFKGFGELILLWDNNTNYYDTPLSDVGSIMPYHSHVDPNVVVSAINHMIDEINNGKTIFYDFYTKRQKEQDPSKKTTGLFFFRGKPGAPFAIICPGGGFAYVGSLHEGFPHALVLSKKGFNVFVLKYRAGSGSRATADLAAAITYVFRNAEMLKVSTEEYSLWGSSAGARMVGDIALHKVDNFSGDQIPKPAVVVIAYTGHTSYSENYPPTFILVSEDDRIVNISIVDRRVRTLRSLGVEVDYRKYKNAGHGFGLGMGTDAEGWLEHAVLFWEKHINY